MKHPRQRSGITPSMSRYARRGVLTLTALVGGLVACQSEGPGAEGSITRVQAAAEVRAAERIEAENAAAVKARTESAAEAREAVEDEPPASKPDSTGSATTPFPGVTLDRERGYLELTGQVVSREVDWLELLACSPGSREYESIFTIDAPASHVHAALLLLGLEPGRPASGEWAEDGTFTLHPPQGPPLAVYVILPDQPDELIPANTWVIDQQNRQPMPDNRWLFTGSRFVEHEGQRWFLAEENGTMISLVNFGDDLIGRDTRQGDEGGNAQWTANTPAIPAVGTPLTIRLVPLAAP